MKPRARMILLLTLIALSFVGAFSNWQSASVRRASRLAIIEELNDTPIEITIDRINPAIMDANLDQVLGVTSLRVGVPVASVTTGATTTGNLRPLRHFKQLEKLDIYIRDINDPQLPGVLSPVSLKPLLDLPNLRELTIESWITPDLRALGNWEQLQALTVGSHADHFRHWKDLHQVQQLTGLRRLALRNVRVDDWRGLTALHELEELDFEYVRFWSARMFPSDLTEPPAEVREQLPNLKTVRFHVE